MHCGVMMCSGNGVLTNTRYYQSPWPWPRVWGLPPVSEQTQDYIDALNTLASRLNDAASVPGASVRDHRGRTLLSRAASVPGLPAVGHSLDAAVSRLASALRLGRSSSERFYASDGTGVDFRSGLLVKGDDSG